MATRAAKVTIKWEDLEDFDESKNILLVGDSGAGKTVLAGGAPDLLFLALENGTISAKRQGSKAKMVRIQDWPSFEAKLDEIDAALDAGDKTFKWLCVDSVPRMQQMLRQHLLNIGVLEGRKGADLDALQLQDYNKWYGMFMRFMDRLVDMPINVIFTSTLMRIEVEDNDGMPQDIVYPAIQGKAREGYAMAQQVCAIMSSVWFLNIEGKGPKRVRALYTQKTLPFFAKCRYGVLPVRLVLAPNDPTTMARILAKIEDGVVLAEEEPEPEEELEMGGKDESGIDDDLVNGMEETTPKPAARRGPVRKAKKPEPELEPEEEDDEFDLEDEDLKEPVPTAKRSTRNTPPKPAAKAATAKSGARRAKTASVEGDLDDDLPEDDDYNY